MPISDLLAQISGGKSSGGPVKPIQRSNSTPLKRKANEDLPRDEPKDSRWSAQPPRPSQPVRPIASSQRVTNGISNTSRPSVPSQKSSVVGNKLARPALPNRPAASPSNANGPPRLPPKKGSFAEILARGKRAQESMGQVGKIQHKKVAKGMTRTEREEVAPVVKAKGRPVASKYSGSAKPVQRNGARPTAKQPESRNGGASRPQAAAARKPVVEEAQKKTKKAVAATTGYTGTSRPNLPNAARKKDAARGGALLNAPAPRSGSSKRSRYEDDYDEELDDFIDYDDEEEEEPRYGYASDASSDMEAGLSDIDVEEKRAEQIARKEDIEEEKRERNLKMAKEERKRKALEALRAGRR